MNNVLIGAGGFLGTIIIYIGAKWLYGKLPNPFLLPILPVTMIIGTFLLISHIPYETYMIGGQVIDWFLGPAVVALAYPLYRHREVMKTYPLTLLAGIGSGSIVGVVTGILFVKWFGFDREMIVSMTPKNATTPVATEITAMIGGVPSLAVVFVMIAGIGGAVCGPAVMKWFKIYHFLGKGAGMGSASHAIGTSKSLENSEEEGAVSTVAMTLSAIMVSLISPFFVWLLL
ncbi:putative murein hydrolase (TIGR00659 family) [Melghiribacillus thermohalophilus]|uniref:Putative murein hydrolase (TIGR00659 family) n=1 Tax=Melghiribacillus thermohalophilus TaxID=1324956 RepID=A0A4V2V1A6_9BACI|nr:LrgB family protein [Melghiribacillus thermohalophilus]TCT20512.1 putative murein hydrolase (TIGR00659 family) [Melghiribacillus thermohalophilus]